jgi:peptide/nickel transport system permease protein
MGTDELGRDFFARMLFGAQVSLLVGFSSMFVAMGIGATLGAIAGYYGGWIDNVLMRVVDAMLALPYLLLLFVLSIIFSNGTVGTVVFIIAILAWPATARIVRGEFLALKHQEFLMATRTLGAGDLRLILRHILPNAAGPIIVNATLLVGLNIINESVLSFFGFGLAAPQSSWGVLLGQSQTFFNAAPRMLYLPGFAILITVLCFNLIGDGLRDALDPHLTQR